MLEILILIAVGAVLGFLAGYVAGYEKADNLWHKRYLQQRARDEARIKSNE